MEYNEQKQSKVVMAYRQCIHTLRGSKCDKVPPAGDRTNQTPSTSRSSTKWDDHKHTAPSLFNNSTPVRAS